MLMLLHFFPAAAVFLHCTSSLLLLLQSFPDFGTQLLLASNMD